MPNSYKDFVCKGIITQGSESQVIITPFVRYMEKVWCDGVDVTYSYRTDPKLLGKVCVLFVQVIDEHPTIPSEVKKAEEYMNTLGISKVDVLTKAQAVAKVDLEGKEVLDAELKPVMEAPTKEKTDAATLLSVHVKEPVAEVAEVVKEVVEEKPIDEKPVADEEVLR